MQPVLLLLTDNPNPISAMSCAPTYCPPRSPQLYFFQGVAGTAGPLAVFFGAYDAATIYYLNSGVSSVVSYGGEYWRTINPAKNGTNGWGTPATGSADWVSIGTFFSVYSGNSWDSGSSSVAGNTTITPTTPNQSYQFTVTGAASLRLIILAVTARISGDRIKLNVIFPATAGITLNVRNASAVGTQLLPTEKFAANTLTTDGVTLSACLEFVFNGTAWIYQTSSLPA